MKKDLETLSALLQLFRFCFPAWETGVSIAHVTASPVQGNSMAGFSSVVLWSSGASSVLCNHQFLHFNCQFLTLKSSLEINFILA